MEIENGKKYVARNGDVIGPICVPAKGVWSPEYTVDLGDNNEFSSAWTSKGEYLYGEEDELDLIKEYVEFDPFTNTTPFGLLPKEHQKVLMEWDGRFTRWEGEKNEWIRMGYPFWCKSSVYRPIPKPSEGTVTFGWDGHLYTITFDLIDGKPDLTSIRPEA